MLLYQGAAPLTVATSSGGSGKIITSGIADTHGWWPVPLVAQGNDARSAANMFAAVEAVTDRTNWIGWRAADWIFGGDYRTLFTGTVIMGGVLAYVGTNKGIVIAGNALLSIGGGLLGDGVFEVQSGSTAAFLNDLPAAGAPAGNSMMYSPNVPKGWAVLATTGGGSTAVTVSDGYNVASAVVNAGNHNQMDVTLGRSMSNTTWCVVACMTDGTGLVVSTRVNASTGVFNVYLTTPNTGVGVDLTGGVYTIAVMIFGRQ